MVKSSFQSFFGSSGAAQRCPECDETIAADAINIKEGVALCPKCGKLSKLSELNCSNRSKEEILSEPPVGCSITPWGQGVIVRASLRSIAGFLFPAGFALFWNGIVSIFVLLAIAGLYANLIGPLPAWFPAPGVKNGKPEMNDGPMELGMTLFLCVFLIPFVTIGTGMAVFALMNLVGKVEVVIDELGSYVATGIGFVVWKRRFDPHQVHTVGAGATTWETNGQTNQLIELVAERTIKFGSMLQRDRMEWMRVVLKELLLQPHRERPLEMLPNLPWLSRSRDR